MKRVLSLLSFVLLINIGVVHSEVFVNFDYSTFRHDSDTALFELYLSAPDSCLKYEYINGKFSTSIGFNVEFTRGNSTIFQDSWNLINSKDSLTNPSHNLIVQRNYNLAYGDYQLNISAYQSDDTSNRFKINKSIRLTKYGSTFDVSDFMLAEAIIPLDQIDGQYDPIFVKSSNYVVPNPSLIFDGKRQLLNSYLEIYGAKSLNSSSIHLKYSISDRSKIALVEIEKELKVTSDALFDVFSLPLDVLNTGAYYLIAEARIENNDGASVVKEKKFYVLNDELPPDPGNRYTESREYQGSEWVVLDEDQVDTEFRKLKPIASPNEIELFNRLTDLNGKRKFLFRFWKQRDLDSNSLFNESLAEYRERIQYSTTYYSIGTRPGWSTDRGRVYLQYGKPTEVNFYPTNGTNRQYEEWLYTGLQGGIKFYFVDITGNNLFILVHSTGMNELRNPDWFSQYVSDSNNDNELFNPMGNW